MRSSALKPAVAAPVRERVSILDKTRRYTVPDEIKAAGVWTYFRMLESGQDPVVTMDGHEMVMLGSNNYLGLASHPKVKEAAIAAVKKGDTVVTAGGLVGKVTKVEDQFVEVEIAANTRVKVVKATLAEVTALGAKPAND